MPPTPAPVLKDLPPGKRILATAHALFYREGIRATGIDRVIAESGVTKVTFYRYYPSKNDLVHAFLEDRHLRWMAWFTDALQRRGARGSKGIAALVPVLREWFADPGYRGCAFINSVGELGASLPGVVEIARRHKREMTQVIAQLLPASRQREKDAQAIALAVDGAIVRAQYEDAPEAALQALARAIKALQAEAAS